MVTTTDLLDGAVGERTENIRYEVLDQDGNQIDITRPRADAAGTITWDPSNRITRQWSGVKFAPTEAAALTAGQHRIRPIMVLSSGAEYTLGVFLYLGGTQQELPGGTWMDTVTMPDRSHQLDKKLVDDYGIAAGTTLTGVLADMAAQSRITATSITPSPQVSGGWLGYAGGDTSRLQVCDTVTNLLGYLPVYFDATGTMIARPIPVPTDEWPDHVYEPGQNGVVYADTPQTTSMPDVPNIWLVRSTSPTGTIVSGRYDVPDDQPNSAVSLGYDNPTKANIDGLSSDTQADLVAFQLAQRAIAQASSVTFSAWPDPTHDAWDIVEWRGTRMLEHSWSLDLTPGGAHQHVLRPVYTA